MDGRVVRARVKRGGRLRTGAAVASVLLLGSLAGLTGCGTTGPSDADRASCQTAAALTTRRVRGGARAQPNSRGGAQPKKSSSRFTRCIARVASVIDPVSEGNTANTRETWSTVRRRSTAIAIG